MGRFKARTEDVDLNKPYKWNERFTVKAPRGGWDNTAMDLDFKFVDVKKYEYESVFGPRFNSESRRYTCDHNGIRSAVRRLTNERKPGTGLHEQLRLNQWGIRDNLGQTLDLYIKFRQDELRPLFLAYDDGIDQVKEWAHQAHAKKKMRVDVYNQTLNDGQIDFVDVRNVSYVCKKGEQLAYGKYLRGVGDLTPIGSQRGAYMMGDVKCAFGVPYIKDRCELQFIKSPDRLILSEVFRKLMEPQKMYFPFFSDDSCIAIRCRDGVFRANMDITQCDGSNFDPIFSILRQIMSVDIRRERDIRMMFAQCKKPCKVRHPYDWKMFVKLIPKYSTLYSGSALTTSINNVANSMIALAIKKSLDRRVYNMAEIPALLEACAASVGFIIRADIATTPEELQFLKHSATLIDGIYEPWVNLGTWFKGFGTCTGDLPGRKSQFADRAKIFNSEVVRSRVGWGDHCVQDAFDHHVIRTRTNVYDKIISNHTDGKMSNGSSKRIPPAALARRYNLELADFMHFVDCVANAEIGSQVSHPALDVIMRVDYGYDAP